MSSLGGHFESAARAAGRIVSIVADLRRTTMWAALVVSVVLLVVLILIVITLVVSFHGE